MFYNVEICVWLFIIKTAYLFTFSFVCFYYLLFVLNYIVVWDNRLDSNQNRVIRHSCTNIFFTYIIYVYFIVSDGSCKEPKAYKYNKNMSFGKKGIIYFEIYLDRYNICLFYFFIDV